MSAVRRAWIVGTGLIGASVGSALRKEGWCVSGTDTDSEAVAAAVETGALDRVGEDGDAGIVFVAVPASQVAAVATDVLVAAPAAAVTDVAGVKAAIVEAVGDPRFVGGHPMAGSEKEGAGGADPSLFSGRTWVLTPTGTTDPAAFSTVHGAVSSLGARVLAMDPQRHDELVALVSHVPHLLAATLLDLAAEESEESAELLQLAAGGFRDMTRVAAGRPDIWPDICAQNSAAIGAVLGELAGRVSDLGRTVVGGDSDELVALLNRARATRSSLPRDLPVPDSVAEVRVPVADRPGVLAEVTTLAAQMTVNIEDIDIVHEVGGGGGDLVMIVDAHDALRLADSLRARGFEPAWRAL